MTDSTPTRMPRLTTSTYVDPHTVVDREGTRFPATREEWTASVYDGYLAGELLVWLVIDHTAYGQANGETRCARLGRWASTAALEAAGDEPPAWFVPAVRQMLAEHRLTHLDVPDGEGAAA